VVLVDEGLPIAYEVLEDGVPVFAADGESVGVVVHVVSVPSEDIFHGVVIRVGTSQRLVFADQIASLHERGVDLRIDVAAVAALPEPHGDAPAWRVHEPGVKPSAWTKLLDRMSGSSEKRRDWTKED
jgi:hypothetical protein